MDPRTAAAAPSVRGPVDDASRTTERLGCAALLLAALVALLSPLPTLLIVPLAAGFGAGALALARSLAGLPNRPVAILCDLVVLALFALMRDPGFRVWQLPTRWADVVGMTPTGSTVSTLLYLGAGMALISQSGRDLATRERVSLLVLPLLFGLALSLGNGGMMHDLGSAWTLGIAFPEPVDLVAGRWVVLFAFCEATLGLFSLLVAGRPARAWQFHALLLGASLHAVMAPHLADLPPLLAGSPLLQSILAIGAAALAQSGLWAIVYVVTGLAIDALNGTPPTYASAYGHWRTGATKGAIYGGVFIASCCWARRVLHDARPRLGVPGLPLRAGAHRRRAAVPAGPDGRRQRRRHAALLRPPRGRLPRPAAIPARRAWSASASALAFYSRPAGADRPLPLPGRRVRSARSPMRASTSPATRSTWRAAGASSCRTGTSTRSARCSAASWGARSAGISTPRRSASWRPSSGPTPTSATPRRPAGQPFAIYPLFNKYGDDRPRPGRRRGAAVLRRIAVRRDQLGASRRRSSASTSSCSPPSSTAACRR